jgi:hypothetical protein
MTFNGVQQQALLEALVVLERGDSRLFEDVLWLRFGDDWTGLRDLLVRRAYIANKTTEREALELTARGLKFVQGLRLHASARSDVAFSRQPAAAVPT